MPVLIRAAAPEDLPALRAIEQQSETAAHWSQQNYDALFAPGTPPRIVLVASEETADAIAGFVAARCTPGEWEIENLVVAGQRRRQGWGTALVRDLVRQAQTAGATSVLLEVRESNLAARRLYEKLGFSQRGRRKNYYRDPREDALLLRFFIAGL